MRFGAISRKMLMLPSQSIVIIGAVLCSFVKMRPVWGVLLPGGGHFVGSFAFFLGMPVAGTIVSAVFETVCTLHRSMRSWKTPCS